MKAKVDLYMAPLEGVTGHVFRSTYCECFGNVDKYFIPFIKPNQKGHLSSRERQDVLPENNAGMYAVPLLANPRLYGYRHVHMGEYFIQKRIQFFRVS